MGPVKNESTSKKKWSEINKARKEERKKWKEKNLEKKKLKNIVKDTVEPSQVETKLQSVSTISIAVPGSILENAQSPELRTYLAGQIARAACIFQVDEVVVFDDFGDEASAKKTTFQDDKGVLTARQSCVQLGRILQYLECPQYLRKSFFPIHKDLKYCGILNPLNAPHHLGPKDDFVFREGVVLNMPVKPGKGSIVNVGLQKYVCIDKVLIPGIRCTVKLLPQQENTKKLKGIVVSPNTPRIETGIYWGYSVRIANSLSKVFSQCSYKGGYDVMVGTSDKGTSVDEFECPSFKHFLLVFGGLHGLEAALENDSVLGADDPKLIFDYYLNALPLQGSKTIRTEEAILVSLSALRPKLNHEWKNKTYKENASEFRETSVIDSGNVKECVSSDGDAEDMSRFD